MQLGAIFWQLSGNIQETLGKFGRMSWKPQRDQDTCIIHALVPIGPGKLEKSSFTRWEQEKKRPHGWISTEILCIMQWSRALQLSRRPFREKSPNRPRPKNVVITKLFAPKFCAECTGRELHSPHGDPFRELFDFRANQKKDATSGAGPSSSATFPILCELRNKKCTPKAN